MKSIQLIFDGISEVAGCNGLVVLRLTDTEKKRCLGIICEERMKTQIGIRNVPIDVRNKFLPEVMMQMMAEMNDKISYRIDITGIANGEYKTMITNMHTFSQYCIRLSDAILFSIISGTLIFIDEQLMLKQSSPYSENQMQMPIPINSLDTKKLQEELDKAINSENYRLASHLKEELDKRKNS